MPYSAYAKGEHHLRCVYRSPNPDRFHSLARTVDLASTSGTGIITGPGS